MNSLPATEETFSAAYVTQINVTGVMANAATIAFFLAQSNLPVGRVSAPSLEGVEVDADGRALLFSQQQASLSSLLRQLS
jgi:hypothetical protein